MSSERAIRIAAIQPELTLGEVERNLRRAEDLVRDAHREHAPDLILLPEAVSSPNVYHRSLRSVARPVDGAPYQLFMRLARELDCLVGGGFHAQRGRDVFGTYVLAEPDGSAHLHDKDLPTMWENNYYRGGDDPGITESTALAAPVGIANGWEWARNRTARRLRGRIRLLAGGMCWPSSPLNWRGPPGAWMRREHDAQKRLAEALPGQVARLIGAPVAIASHVGEITMGTPLAPGVRWRTEMVGETQICDRDGSVLARLAFEDGEGHVAAEVELAQPAPLGQPADRYWIPEMTLAVHATFHPTNVHGAVKYRLMRVLRRHSWQESPAIDSPDEIPAALAPDPLTSSVLGSEPND